MRILDKNRTKYNRKFTDDDACVFCRRDETLETDLENEHFRVVVNQFPYMDGNVMIVPKRHIERLVDIDRNEWQAFGDILTKVQVTLAKIFKTESFNIGLNLGPESGASIPHLHWQLIPRSFKNITVMNTFADLYIVKITPEETKRLIDDFISSNQ